jgi:hypothetical protein
MVEKQDKVKNNAAKEEEKAIYLKFLQKTVLERRLRGCNGLERWEQATEHGGARWWLGAEKGRSSGEV